MPSVQRFLSGRHNLARTALVAASSVRASTAIERVAASRAGGGRVRLGGSYTGHEATQVQVEVLNAGGVPRASVPQFVGVGNGQLAVQAVAAGAALQQFTLTLADLGVDTASAGLDVRELRLRARVPGAAGNAIRITVQPQLVRTPTDKALLADWGTGAATQTGPQWDFGGLPLSAKDELDGNSPRIAFGFDPQVYRPWRRFKDGDWQFGLSPQLQRHVPAGTPVLAVTGGYVVTVSDGLVSEVFGDTQASPAQPAIVTFYDLLTALAASTLVEVAGVVAADRLAGGQAAIDVPLVTSAWLLAMGGKVRLQDVAVPAGAPTQGVTVRCINADVVGQERWSVAGDVSGALAVATTGLPYVSAAALFTVPRIDPPAQGSGRWSFKYSPAPRDEAKGLPSLCVRPFRFGRNAAPRTVTFRYAKRPPADCKCSDMPTPKLSLKCLGLTSGDDDMPLDPAYQTRLETLYEWRSDFHQSNWAKYYVPPKDLDFADAITSVFAAALAEIYEHAAAASAWDAALTAMKLDLQDLQGMQFSNWAGGNLPEDMPRLDVDSGENMHGVEIIPPEYSVNDNGSLPIYLKQRLSNDISDIRRKYVARMDYVRTLAGIVPKSDPSSADAGGCWVDHGGTHWWVDADGYYLPAFTNEAYVSARRDTETGNPYSTMEFGFGLVVACPERLLVGDELTIRIEAVDGARPYSVGDEATLQTVGAGAAWLAGGVDGSDVQTWRVTGSAAGVLPDYLVPTDGTPAPVYAAAGVDLRLALGGIGFALGDAFSFAVEAGQFRWRAGGGAWSAAADIPPAGPALLPDGLELHFDAGAAPSFVPGDAYGYQVHQPHAASHVQDAGATAWGWAGADASMTVDLGAVQPLGAVGLARYQLPAGAAVSLQLSDDGSAWGAPWVLDTSRAPCVRFLDVQARFVRINLTGAPGGTLGWLWLGQPLATKHHASSAQRRRRWAVQRASGPNAAGLFAGAGDGWQLAWDNALGEEDAQALLQLVDWAQQRDEPLILAPHHLHPQDAALVRCTADALELRDIHEYQPNDAGQRLLSATLELEPVYA